MTDSLDFLDLDFDPPPPQPSSVVPAYWPPRDLSIMQHVMVLARCSVDYHSPTGLKCYYSTHYQLNHRFNVIKDHLLPHDLGQIIGYMGGSIMGYGQNQHIAIGLERALIKGVLAVLNALRFEDWHSQAIIIKIPSPDWIEKLRDPIVAHGVLAAGPLEENHIVPNAWLWASMVVEIRTVVLDRGTDVHFQLMPQDIRTQIGCLERMGAPNDTVEPRLDHWAGVRRYVERGPIQWMSFWKSEGRVDTLEGYTAKPWYNHG